MSWRGSPGQTAVDERYARHLCDLHFPQWLRRVGVVFGRKLRAHGEGSAPGAAAASAAWERRRDRIRQQPQRVVASSRHDFGLRRAAELGPGCTGAQVPKLEILLLPYQLIVCSTVAT